MNWHELELMARGGTLALLALWTWLLWRDHRQQISARLAMAMNLGISAYVFESTHWIERNDLQGLLLGLFARSTPALLWLFARAWFGDRTRLTTGELMIVGASAANALIMHFSYNVSPELFGVSAVVFRASMCGFAAAALWEAWRGRADDLIEARRRLRLALVITIGLYVLAIALAEMAVFNAHAPVELLALVGSSTVISTMAFCAMMFASRQSDLFGARSMVIPDRVGRTDSDDLLAAKLLALMNSELPHRDENITIAALAQTTIRARNASQARCRR